MKKKTIGLITALALASVVSADMSLDFVYESTTDTTTVSWNGAMGVNSTGTANLSSPRTYLMAHILEGVGNVGSVSYIAMDATANTPWDDISATAYGSNFTGDNWRFDSNNYIGPASFIDTTEVDGSMDFVGSNLAELGFDATEIANGGTFILDTAGGDVNVNWSASSVPEPATAGLLGISALGLWLFRRAKNHYRS